MALTRMSQGLDFVGAASDTAKPSFQTRLALAVAERTRDCQACPFSRDRVDLVAIEST